MPIYKCHPSAYNLQPWLDRVVILKGPPLGPHKLYIDRFVLPNLWRPILKFNTETPVYYGLSPSASVWPTFGGNYIKQIEGFIFGETGHRKCTLA